MTVQEHHRVERKPGSQTGDKAIVLGAREGNIGGAIADRLVRAGWIACEDDCHRVLPVPEETEQSEGFFVPEYNPPHTEDIAPFDACIITLGATHMEPFSEVSRKDFRKVIYGSLELPLECARRYVRGRKTLLRTCSLCRDKLFVEGGTLKDAGSLWVCERCGGNEPAMDKLGTIVFVGSYAHDHPFTHCTSYCVAKAGLDMAAKTLAWELMPEGFDVHIIHPHHVQGTPMTDEVRQGMKDGVHKMTDEEAFRYQYKDLRMPDLLKPREIAEMVYLLLTQPVARWLSGQGVNMYGGVR